MPAPWAVTSPTARRSATARRPARFVGAWPPPGAALGRRSPREAARRLLHSLRQAGPPARRIRRTDPPAAAAIRLAVPLLQDLEAFRPGHHGHAGRLQYQAR